MPATFCLLADGGQAVSSSRAPWWMYIIAASFLGLFVLRMLGSTRCTITEELRLRNRRLMAKLHTDFSLATVEEHLWRFAPRR
jgi:hypothetical protein